MFWVCLFLIAYPYAIYPLVLVGFNRLLGRKPHVASDYEPTVTVILPVHNEARRIAEKVRNLLELDYPHGKLQLLVIGDACTDDSLERARAAGAGLVDTIPLATRAGKAAGLNAGLERATGEIVVFTDAGIMLERQSLRRLVAHFSDPVIACVSGEDTIEGGGDSEGFYGRLELLFRREEARLHSIAGASGCFYAQRRSTCKRFIAGMAPDFLSVLVTVTGGYRALAEPAARGSMTAASSQRAEFTRKVRTFLRGITALFGNAHLLNPFRYPAFSFILWSHKLMRWLAPLPMAGALITSWMLRDNAFYLVAFGAQVVCYAMAVAGLLWPALAARVSLVRLTAFFVLVNAAAFKALLLWISGSRLEVWEPTRRPQ